MSIAPKSGRNWASAALGAGLSVALGLALARLPIGDGLVRCSYDLAFAFRPDVRLDETTIVGIDEKSLDALKQKPGQAFDRALHADLLERLSQAKLVVFDVQLADSGPPTSDSKLAEAIRRHGKVVLAADLVPFAPPLVGYQIRRAQELFLTNALGWGIARRDCDPDNVSRRHYPGVREAPGLAAAAAALAGAPGASGESEERWLNYYGPGAIRVVSYTDALEPGQSPTQWGNKFVFVGYLPQTQYPGMAEDEAPTPFARWGSEGRTGGVKILATAFMNLYRGDWLRRLAGWNEILVLVLVGVIVGSSLRIVGPWPGLGLAASAMLIAAAAGVGLVWSRHVWFPWMVVAAVQIPFIYLFSLVDHAASFSAGRVRTQPTPQVRPKRDRDVCIPNYDLLRCIGEGAYGQVWLARNPVGLYFAAKIVTRESFADAAPYEREFRGIEKYMPVSMSHPGLLQILHVGRDESQGFFYSIMELGDDTVSGREIVPDRYAPKSLASEIRRRGAQSPEACLSLLLHLSEALVHLHEAGRIHRDIKPANIIYLHGTPKFADIGLVTDISPGGAAPTLIGTRGYICPEGPGTVMADVYSLGMVLYVALSGLRPDRFPELSTAPLLSPVPLQDELLKIVFKACESDWPRRYQTAAQMRVDLLSLASHGGQTCTPSL